MFISLADPHMVLIGAGRLLAFQVRCVRSSRSRPWPLGRCTLQPGRPSGRHAEEGAIETGKLASISRAIPGKLHSSVANAAASGPAFNNRTSSSRCDLDGRSGRPKCSAHRSACSPLCWRSRLQRITVWRVTHARRATSACGRPQLAASPGAVGVAPALCASVSVRSVPECNNSGPRDPKKRRKCHPLTQFFIDLAASVRGHRYRIRCSRCPAPSMPHRN